MMIVGAKVLNATKAIDAAYEHFGIPKIISPQDLTNPDVDDLRHGSCQCCNDVNSCALL